MTTIKLFSFPYTVQRTIFQTMGYDDLFLISLCSKNTKRFVKFIQKSSSKNIAYIKCYARFEGLSVTVVMRNNEFSPVLVLQPHSVPYFNSVGWQYIHQTEIAGRNFDVFLPVYGEFLRPTIFYDSDDGEEDVETIHSYICDLFGYDKEYRLEADGFFYTEAKLVSRLKNINITNFGFRAICDAEDIDSFFSASPNQKFVTGSIELCGELRENSEFYQTDIIDIYDNDSMTSGILKNFNGRKAFLSVKTIETSDITQLINRWKSNEEFQNLEFLTVQIRNLDASFDIDEIKSFCDVKELDPSNEPLVYKGEIEFFGYSLLSWKLTEFSSRGYVVRDSDQHVASVSIHEKQFVIAVWNITKKEFLENKLIAEGKITFKKPVKRTVDADSADEEAEKKKKKSTPTPTVKKGLLSFGDDEEEEDC
ncbi:hypothetical protein CRE_03803 [Caenorhabditis remanei]|uniref:F-box domain-containing protein n=1 Tax=Caenorhabditis remanei TaxID=31234 RepID=E3LYC8_CAERE|nr:hypothetical protein CRE_03803 [Caenorhabditis remanei]